jgi:hypothetical protein
LPTANCESGLPQVAALALIADCELRKWPTSGRSSDKYADGENIAESLHGAQAFHTATPPSPVNTPLVCISIMHIACTSAGIMSTFKKELLTRFVGTDEDEVTPIWDAN